MSYFFISYQRKHKRFAKLLKKKLEQSQILCWIDENIPLGDPWKHVIDTEIRTSIGMIVIVTPDSLKSQYVTYEWSYAMGLGKRVIPIMLEYPDPNNPEHLKIHPKIDDQQNLDFSKSRKHPWAELTQKLETILKQEDLPKNIREAEDGIHNYDPDQRKKATAFLMNHPHPAVIDIFARACQSESPDIAINAGKALAQKSNYKDDRAVAGLEKGIKDNDSNTQNILSILIQMNSDAAIECIVHCFDTALPASNLQNQIIDYASSFTNPKIIPVLRMMVNKSTGLRTTLVGALERFAHPDTLPELLSIAARTDIGANSRAQAIITIGKIGNPQTLEELFAIANSLKQLHFQEDFIVFEAVLNAFVAIGGVNAKNLVVILQKDRRFSDRYSAMRIAILNMEA